jgi:hypothetical protein
LKHFKSENSDTVNVILKWFVWKQTWLQVELTLSLSYQQKDQHSRFCLSTEKHLFVFVNKSSIFKTLHFSLKLVLFRNKFLLYFILILSILNTLPTVCYYYIPTKKLCKCENKSLQTNLNIRRCIKVDFYVHDTFFSQ